MINLQSITWSNYWEVIQLKVDEVQRNFVADNIVSLAEAFVAHNQSGYTPITKAIYNDETLVGFLMVSYLKNGHEYDLEDAPFTPDGSPCYLFHRFMIAKEHQGKGYGKEALLQTIDYIKTKPQGEAKYFYTSFEPENESARILYKKVGFKEDGRIIDDEEVFIMSI